MERGTRSDQRRLPLARPLAAIATFGGGAALLAFLAARAAPRPAPDPSVPGRSTFASPETPPLTVHAPTIQTLTAPPPDPAALFHPTGAHAMDLAVDAAGTVWAAGDSLRRFPGGDATRCERLPVGSGNGTAVLASGDEIWAGGWHGQLVRGNEKRWRNVADPARKGRVKALGAWNGRVFAVLDYQRLYEWDEVLGSWSEAAGVDPWANVEVLESTENGLLAGGNVVHRLDASGWQQLPLDTPFVRSLAGDADGRIYVGSDDGLQIFSATGQLVEHALRRTKVESIAVLPDGRLWVGTWGYGLRYREKGRWYEYSYRHGLADDDVTAVLVHRERLWVSFYGGPGLVTAPEEKAAAAVRAAEAPAPIRAIVHPDLATAVQEELGVRPSDGAVAVVRTADGRLLAFFDGKPAQTRTAGCACRRADGAWASISQDWKMRIGAPGQREVQIPDPELAEWQDSATVCFLDSSGRVWVGTGRSGVFLFTHERGWTRFGESAGLAKDHVRAFAETPDGTIWMGGGERLHSWNGTKWIVFGKEEAQIEWAVMDLAVCSDGTLAAAALGVVTRWTDGDHHGFSKIGRADGLEKESIQALTEGPDATLWLSHFLWGNGISWIDRDVIHTLDSRDGLYSDRVERMAVDGRGRVWMIEIDGAVAIYDRDVLERAAALRVESRQSMGRPRGGEASRRRYTIGSPKTDEVSRVAS